MSAPKRSRGPAASRKPATRPGARRAVVPWLIVALLALAAAWGGHAWWRARAQARPEAASTVSVPSAGLDTQAMLDSVRACYGTRQWERALAWAHASNVAAPGNAGLLLNEALAWHNWAMDASQQWPGRSASRTSLDRMALEQRAFALLDSAEAVASLAEDRANIRRWRGTLYEVLGLPLDAMREYEAALEMVPGHAQTLPRLAWIQRSLVRPAAPGSVTADDAAPRP